MGLFDRSKSTTNQNLTTVNENRPVTITDSAGAQAFDSGGGDIYAVSTDFNAIDKATALAQSSLDAAAASASDAKELALKSEQLTADLAEHAIDTPLSFARDLQSKFQDTIASTVDAIQRIGVEQNKSTDQRLQESTQTMLKYAVIGLGVMALGLVAFSVYSRR